MQNKTYKLFFRVLSILININLFIFCSNGIHKNKHIRPLEKEIVKFFFENRNFTSEFTEQFIKKTEKYNDLTAIKKNINEEKSEIVDIIIEGDKNKYFKNDKNKCIHEFNFLLKDCDKYEKIFNKKNYVLYDPKIYMSYPYSYRKFKSPLVKGGKIKDKDEKTKKIILTGKSGVIKYYRFPYNKDNWDFWSSSQKADYLLKNRFVDTKKRPISKNIIDHLYVNNLYSKIKVTDLNYKGKKIEDKYINKKKTIIFRGITARASTHEHIFQNISKKGFTCGALRNKFCDFQNITSIDKHKFTGYKYSIFVSTSKDVGVAALFASSNGENPVSNKFQRYNRDGLIFIIEIPAKHAIDYHRISNNQDIEKEVLVPFIVDPKYIIGAIPMKGKDFYQPLINKNFIKKHITKNNILDIFDKYIDESGIIDEIIDSE